MKKVKGYLGRIIPKRGTVEGRKHSLTMTSTPDGDLLLLISNDKGTWSTDLLLSPAETADLVSMATTHLAGLATQEVRALKVVGG